jgi:hypothetical protein
VWSETLASQWPRSISGAQPDERQPRSESRGSGRRYSVRAGEAGGADPDHLQRLTGGAARPRPSDVAARRAPHLPLVAWTSGLGRELLEVPPVPGLPPAQIDSTRSRRSRGAGRDRTLDRPHGRRHRARRGFGDGGLAVAELPQIAVSETIFWVACERDCCAVLVAARAPRPARHSPGRTVIRPASAACLRAS